MPESRHILHVDMDAFYASVEVLDNPELAGKPVIVGGSAEGRGVVSAASYEARRYGVHSATPAARARRLCPQGVFLPVRMSRYMEVSARIHAIFNQYTPLVQPISLDEAFLDVTGSRRLFGPAEQIAREIKRRIRDELHLVASVGVAPNMFLAKLASDLDKPDGFVVVPRDRVEAFLAPLPVSRLWGAGKVTQKALARLNITTIGQIQRLTREHMAGQFGQGGEHLGLLAHGRDDRRVTPDAEAKSISAERTFAHDIADLDSLERHLLEMCEHVAWRLRRNELQGRTIQLKARYGEDFRTITRSESRPNPTDVTDEIWRTAQRLLASRVDLGRGALRLLGVGVAGLTAHPVHQLDLFDSGRTARLRDLDRAVDDVRMRFGDEAMKRARLLEPEDD